VIAAIRLQVVLIPSKEEEGEVERIAEENLREKNEEESIIKDMSHEKGIFYNIS
jgi:hypothetical protein